jgi:outer membrane receptor protein involved in Fe transport
MAHTINDGAAGTVQRASLSVQRHRQLRLHIGSLPQRDASANIKTYLANVKYKLTDTVMPYLRFATGYRPGGPNVVANNIDGQPLAPPVFSADTLHSYEAGLKASTPDRRYSVDAALYWINWNNLLITAERNGIGVVANASSARNKGAELTLTAVPIDALTVLGTFGYINARLVADSPDLGVSGLAASTITRAFHNTGSLPTPLSTCERASAWAPTGWSCMSRMSLTAWAS